MTTARYPKEVLLERIDAKIVNLADEQSQEQSELLSQARDFVVKTEKALLIFQSQIDEIARQAALTRETLGNSQRDVVAEFEAAAKLSSIINTFDSNWPSPYWRRWQIEQEIRKLAKKYEVKKRFLEGKRQIIEAADAPDGFTMTALEKLHLLEAIG